MKIYKIFVLFVFCGVNFFNHEVLAVQAQCKEVFIEDLREENLRMTSALHILESVLSKNQKSTEVEVEHWFRSLQIAQRQGTPIKIIEHTAIVFLLKKNFVKDETLLQDMKESLRQSWFNFTGKTPAEVMSRLPKSLLKDATRDEVLFHQAVYHEGPLGFLNAMKMLANDYIFKPKDAIYALLLGSALFSNAGAEVLAAAMEGYAVASFAEYLMHRYAAHASKKSIEFLNSWAWLKKQVQEVAFSHSVVHHGSYGGSYVERFAPKNGASENAELKRLEKKAQIDELIRRQEQDVVNRIARSEYGTKLTSPWIDTVLSAPLSVTVALLTKYAANSFGIELDPGYYITLLTTSALYVPASNYLHPYLHLTKEKAIKMAGLFMKWFLQTRYVAWVASSHYTHHSDGGHYNQNLVMGADFLFGYQPITVEQLLKLKKEGAIY